MAHACIDHLRPAGGGPVAQAVAVCAQKRTALDDLARNSKLGLSRVVAVCRTALLGRARLSAVPVGSPLPDIACHVEQPVAVGRETSDGCGGAVSSVGQIRK